MTEKKMLLLKMCQGGESDSRPRDYDALALPLSYPGNGRIILEGISILQVWGEGCYRF